MTDKNVTSGPSLFIYIVSYIIMKNVTYGPSKFFAYNYNPLDSS